MCFAAGLTELETEVHPRPGMQSRGWIYPQCLSLCLAATRGVSRAASACSALASSLLNLPVAREGLVPGEPRTRHLGEQHWVQQFILHRCWPEAMGGFMHVTRLHYPAVLFFFLQPHLLLHGLHPDGRVSAQFPDVRELGFILSPGGRVLR